MDRLHPHALVGSFVHSYETIMFPYLRKGDASTPYPAILDAIDRAREVKKFPEEMDYSPRALALYDGAIRELSCLVRAVEKRAGKELISHFIAIADRHVSDIELTLSRDEIYKKYRNQPTDEN